MTVYSTRISGTDRYRDVFILLYVIVVIIIIIIIIGIFNVDYIKASFLAPRRYSEVSNE